MFVSQKVVSGKLFSKLSCVCLPLEKLVNRKHFLVNRKTLFGQQKIFQSKKNLAWFLGKCFPLAVFVFRKVVSEKSLSKLSCVYLPFKKLVNGKHYPVKGKFSFAGPG